MEIGWFICWILLTIIPTVLLWFAWNYAVALNIKDAIELELIYESTGAPKKKIFDKDNPGILHRFVSIKWLIIFTATEITLILIVGYLI